MLLGYGPLSLRFRDSHVIYGPHPVPVMNGKTCVSALYEHSAPYVSHVMKSSREEPWEQGRGILLPEWTVPFCTAAFIFAKDVQAIS